MTHARLLTSLLSVAGVAALLGGGCGPNGCGSEGVTAAPITVTASPPATPASAPAVQPSRRARPVTLPIQVEEVTPYLPRVDKSTVVKPPSLNEKVKRVVTALCFEGTGDTGEVTRRTAAALEQAGWATPRIKPSNRTPNAFSLRSRRPPSTAPQAPYYVVGGRIMTGRTKGACAGDDQVFVALTISKRQLPPGATSQLAAD